MIRRFSFNVTALMQRMRPFLLIAALATAASCSKFCKNGGVEQLSENLELIPADTSFVSVINVQKIMQSHLGMKAKELGEQESSANPGFKKGYDEFVTKCHLDPGKQIDVIFNALPTNFERDIEEATTIIRGKFAEKDILGCLDAYKSQGLERTSSDSHGYTVHEVTVGINKKLYFVFPTGKDLIIVGKRSRVEQALAIRDKKANSAKNNQPLNSLMDRASAGDAAIWGVGILSAEQSTKVKNLTTRAIELDVTLKSLTWSIIAKENAECKLQLDTSSKEEAQKAMGVVNQKLEKLKMLPQVQMLGMTTFLNLIKTETKNEALLVNVNISQAQIDDLTTRLAGFGRTFQ